MNANLTYQRSATNLPIVKVLKKKEVTRSRPPPYFLKVLIVDHDKHRGVANATVITELGHSVELAHDGISGLRMAATNRPDALLINTDRRDFDDCDVVCHIRTDYPDCPPLIIGIASHATSATRQQSVTDGMDLVLEAPLEATVIETLLLLECGKLEVERNRIRDGSFTIDIPGSKMVPAFDRSFIF